MTAPALPDGWEVGIARSGLFGPDGFSRLGPDVSPATLRALAAWMEGQAGPAEVAAPRFGIDLMIDNLRYLQSFDRQETMWREFQYMGLKVHAKLAANDTLASEFLAELAKPGRTIRLRTVVDLVEFPVSPADAHRIAAALNGENA